MLFRFLGAAAALSLMAAAQSSTTSSHPSTTSSPSPTTAPSGAPASSTSSYIPQTHSVAVGPDGFSFIPNSITANVTDVIEFHFFPANHSVIRAEYLIPCIPYEDTGAGKVGFYSGFVAVNESQAGIPTWSLTVNDTSPVFFFCDAPSACVPNGMVGVINPNSTQTIAAQIQAVQNAKIQLAPGEPVPPEASAGMAAAGASPTGSTSGGSSGGGGGLSGGAIAGIVVGAIVVVALAGVALYLCGRNRTLSSVLRYSHPPNRDRGSTIPEVPYSPSNNPNAPYSPGFEPKANTPVPSPGMPVYHDSWGPQGPVQRLQSPEMGQPQSHYPSGYGYNPVENPTHDGSNYHIQSSPSETPWSPGGHGAFGRNNMYLQQHPTQELAGTEGPRGTSVISSAGPGSPGRYQQIPDHELQNQGPHELDARPSVPEPAGAQPPAYAARAFSFSGGPEAPPGVEKVLRSDD